MQSPSNTATQLQEARQRIALLEQELAALRSATPSPDPTHPPHITPPLNHRPSIMTRRASAAAAAAAAVSAVAADLAKPPVSNPTLSPAPSEVSRHVSEHTAEISPVASSTFEEGPNLVEPKKLKEPKKDVKRRPPPLPAIKTTSMKKERVTLVAKCTEPRAGQTRYWTNDEHERFLEAVAEYGEKAYVAISNYVETRTPKQVRTHAQKFQMKMARLAKQSIDAGEPVHMPAGMNPVVQVNNAEGKPSLVALQPGPLGVPGVVAVPGRTQGHVPVVIAPPPSKTQGKKKPVKKSESSKPADALVKVSSVISDESSSALTDPYIDYIGTTDNKVHMELENTFAEKLNLTLQGNVGEKGPVDGELLTSDGSSNDSGSVGRNDDDDLEDLENLEDQDLSFAAFTTTGENWFMSDVSG